MAISECDIDTIKMASALKIGSTWLSCWLTCSYSYTCNISNTWKIKTNACPWINNISARDIVSSRFYDEIHFRRSSNN